MATSVIGQSFISHSYDRWVEKTFHRRDVNVTLATMTSNGGAKFFFVHPLTMMIGIITVAQISKTIGLPFGAWWSKCHEHSSNSSVDREDRWAIDEKNEICFCKSKAVTIFAETQLAGGENCGDVKSSTSDVLGCKTTHMEPPKCVDTLNQLELKLNRSTKVWTWTRTILFLFLSIFYNFLSLHILALLSFDLFYF